MMFLQKLVKYFPLSICKMQTNNGMEFTKSFTEAEGGDMTLFEQQLKAFGIERQKIRCILLGITVKCNISLTNLQKAPHLY